MYQMDSSDASLYGGIVGVAAVYVIIASFIYVAYGEEKGLEKRYKEIKKDKWEDSWAANSLIFKTSQH